MSMHNFSFNGMSLSSFGGRLLQPPVHTIARRNTTRVKIYGQSGDEIIDNGSYDNVDFSLQIGFLPHLTNYNAQQLARAVIDWLAPLQNGYYVYRDSLNSGYFTNAQLTNFDEIQRELRTLLTATLNFTRVPYWYADSGTEPVKYIRGGTDHILANPEQYSSEPLYELYDARPAGDSATITVNGKSTTITTPRGDSSYYFDNVRKQFYRYYNDDPDDKKVYLGDLLLPDLVSGDNILNFNVNGMVQGSFWLKVTPNWRRL